MKVGICTWLLLQVHIYHEAWLINLGASFHFTPHRELFCEYDRKARITGRGKVKLKLQGGRIRTLLGVMHIPTLAINLISISKLDDIGVRKIFEKDTCKMVWGALIFIWGVRIGILYKLLHSTVIDGCKNYVVPKSGEKHLMVAREKTMLWHQRLVNIGEKGL